MNIFWGGEVCILIVTFLDRIQEKGMGRHGKANSVAIIMFFWGRRQERMHSLARSRKVPKLDEIGWIHGVECSARFLSNRLFQGYYPTVQLRFLNYDRIDSTFLRHQYILCVSIATIVLYLVVIQKLFNFELKISPTGREIDCFFPLLSGDIHPLLVELSYNYYSTFNWSSVMEEILLSGVSRTCSYLKSTTDALRILGKFSAQGHWDYIRSNKGFSFENLRLQPKTDKAIAT